MINSVIVIFLIKKLETQEREQFEKKDKLSDN